MVVNTSGLLVKTQNELESKKTELDLKMAEIEGLSSRMATSDRELASLKLSVEQSEKARENFAALAHDAEERERQSLSAAEEERRTNERLRGEIAALQCSVEAAKQQAVVDFLKSPEFDAHCAGELLPYYYQGRNHALRMASADGIAVDQLLSWAAASHYCARARSQHGVVEFSEDELITAREEDAENGLEPWVPPPILPNNVTQLADHLQAGGGAKFENGLWTLTDPPAGDKAGPSS